MAGGFNVFNVLSGLLSVIGVGLVIALMFTGGGLVIPFLNIPWYVWTGLLLLLVLFIVKD